MCLLYFVKGRQDVNHPERSSSKPPPPQKVQGPKSWQESNALEASSAGRDQIKVRAECDSARTFTVVLLIYFYGDSPTRQPVKHGFKTKYLRAKGSSPSAWSTWAYGCADLNRLIKCATSIWIMFAFWLSKLRRCTPWWIRSFTDADLHQRKEQEFTTMRQIAQHVDTTERKVKDLFVCLYGAPPALSPTMTGSPRGDLYPFTEVTKHSLSPELRQEVNFCLPEEADNLCRGPLKGNVESWCIEHPVADQCQGWALCHDVKGGLPLFVDIVCTEGQIRLGLWGHCSFWGSCVLSVFGLECWVWCGPAWGSGGRGIYMG